MQHATVTKVYISNKSKEGREFKDKNGKPYWKVAVKTDKTGEDYYSCLAFKDNDPILDLKEGDEKIFVFTEENGYKNFKLSSRLDILEGRLNEVHQRLSILEGKKAGVEKKVDYPESIDPDDIPF